LVSALAKDASMAARDEEPRQFVRIARHGSGMPRRQFGDHAL
jgi:hypothetical protein